MSGSQRDRSFGRAGRRLLGAPPASGAASRAVPRYGDGRPSPPRALRTTPATCRLSLGGLAQLLTVVDRQTNGSGTESCNNPSPSDSEVFPLRNTRTGSARRAGLAPAEAP